jgi:hypothetical protein
MTDDPRTAPLREWSRLAQENTENAMVSSMFEAAVVASEPIDSFSTWLLLGTAAVGGFVISNADKVIPLLTKTGFVTAGVLLVLSCVFGVLSKALALRMKVMKETGARVKATFLEHLAKYEEEETKIEEGAKFWGITIQTGVRMDRILEEFYKPLPAWARWLGRRHMEKNKGNPQIQYLPLIKTMNGQGMFAFVQVLLFIAFLGTAFIFAAGV